MSFSVRNSFVDLLERLATGVMTAGILSFFLFRYSSKGESLPSIDSGSDVIPEPQHGFTPIVVVAKDAKGSGAEHKQAAAGRVETKPAGGKDSREVAAGKQKGVRIQRP